MLKQPLCIRVVCGSAMLGLMLLTYVVSAVMFTFELHKLQLQQQCVPGLSSCLSDLLRCTNLLLNPPPT
jgi:hypothetical protein